MAQYRAEILRPEVGYAEAVNRLAHMDDGELITQLQPDMLAYHDSLNYRAWQPEEPEHESLVPLLRHQARADLLAAYFGEQDYCADAHLAFSHTRPYPTLIYLAPFENEDEYVEDDFALCNPVQRLRTLGICAGPTVETEAPLNTADGYPVTIDLNVGTASGFGNVAYVPSTSTVSGYTVTARPPIRRRTPTLTNNWRYVQQGSDEEAMHWLNANADIARLQAAVEELDVRPRMSDLDVIDESELF